MPNKLIVDNFSPIGPPTLSGGEEGFGRSIIQVGRDKIFWFLYKLIAEGFISSNEETKMGL
jgi:hypothetical protein